MKTISIFALSLLLASTASALAQNPWAGQPAGTPILAGDSPFIGPVAGSISTIYTYTPACFDPTTKQTTADPAKTACPTGSSPTTITTRTRTAKIPAAATGKQSQLFLEVGGFYADPQSPVGVSAFSGFVPLSDFATADSVNAAIAQMNQGFASLQSQLNAQRSELTHYAAQGVAQAIALGGVGEIGSDEKIALNANFGSYDGQSAAAIGLAVRVSQHVSVNAGFSGMGAGHYGVRAGFHIGW